MTSTSPTMKAPTISVIIPAYNAGESIIPTLESILGQTVPPAEIIVIDDGSVDHTCEVVQRFAPRVTLLKRENGGPAAARHTGIQVSSGEWIAFLDADDIWLPKKLERQIPQMLDGISLVHCYEVDSGDDTELEMNFDNLWDHNYIGTSTVVLRKSAYEAVGGFNVERRFIGIEDYNLWLRLAHAGHKIVTVHEELILYTPAENSLSQRYANVIRAELLNVNVMGELLKLPTSKLQAKRIALYEEYASALLWKRDLPMARKYFGELIKEKPSASAIIKYLSTFLPSAILDLKRKTTMQNA